MLLSKARTLFSQHRLAAVCFYLILSAALFLCGYHLLGPLFSAHPTASISSSTRIPDSVQNSAPLEPGLDSISASQAPKPPLPGSAVPSEVPNQTASDATTKTDRSAGTGLSSSSLPDATQTVRYSVNAGTFTSISSASVIADALRSSGYAPQLLTQQLSDRTLYELRIGVYKSKENAEKVADSVRAKGVEAYLVVVP